MDGQVIFGADGIARFQSSYNTKTAVPLVLIQQYLGLDNYPFFIQKMRHQAVIEAGSTVGSFLLCLAPWAEVCSDLTDRQVGAYITELRKPSTREPAFDRCEIRTVFWISRSMIHEPMPDGADWQEWLNRPRGEPQWADTYDMDRQHRISGYKKGDPDNYSMSTSIHELKNVPLIVNPQSIMRASGSKPENTPVFADVPGVFKEGTDDRGTRYIRGTVDPVLFDNQLSVLDLIQVVIEDGLWFDSPRGADNQKAVLTAIMENIDLDGDEVDEGEEPEVDENAPKTISVAPGAFDSVIAHEEHEEHEWDTMMKAIQPTGQYPFRIGEIKEDTPADDRAFGIIFSGATE